MQRNLQKHQKGHRKGEKGLSKKADAKNNANCFNNEMLAHGKKGKESDPACAALVGVNL